MKGQVVLQVILLCCVAWAVLDGTMANGGQTGLRLKKVRQPSGFMLRESAFYKVMIKDKKMQNYKVKHPASLSQTKRAIGNQARSIQGVVGSSIQRDGAVPGARAALSRMPTSAGSPNLLATFAGKNRLLVISAPHKSDGYYRLMMSLLKPNVYCELAERHVHQIVMFHQEGEMGGKVRRITNVGKVMEEPLDVALIPRLMNFLKLEKGKFGMVLLKKTLQVEERYPYPVRLEAMYEVLDQSPMRKMEKARQKGFIQKCKDAGEEGQVVEGIPITGTQVDPPILWPERKKESNRRLTTITTTVRLLTTTSTTTHPTTTTRHITTSTPTTTAQRTAKPHTTPQLLPNAKATTKNHHYNFKDHSKAQKNIVQPTTSFFHYTKAYNGKNSDNRTDRKDNARKQPGIGSNINKPNKSNPPSKKNGGDELSNTYENKQGVGKPTDAYPNKKEVEGVSTNKGKVKPDKTEKKKKDETDKPPKKDKSESRAKEEKNRKKGKKDKKEKKETQKPKKPPLVKTALETFLEYFENRRRLILITAPTEENKMYVQQRDEYLEHVCEMAIRKVSIITIFGTLTNSTMKIDHYQLDDDRPMNGLREEDLVNQDLITELRKEFGMTSNNFYMVLTDLDIKWKQFYEVPIAMKAVFGYIDTFSSRIREMDQQKRDGVTCKKEKPRSLENFLSRFRWRRRLFVISAPSDEDWAYQQQLYAMSSQTCNLGLRHMSILKLLGTEMLDMDGILELYAINGSGSVDRESLSVALVRDIRNYFQISHEYFSMLLVGKDGNVKSWYPSPMWSMDIIYDLIDSMQLRRQEMTIQQSLGIQCPETEYEYHHGYHYGHQQGYHEGYGY
ncbi:coiled-coil domain-containing protein 80 [Trichomycterus rosablanca]|uniref:coiled-coil domain-containing protein 80 n=1 Tax=Trichomycterus rosablanca TaxID=2290929 RepID=UPI002F3605D7